MGFCELHDIYIRALNRLFRILQCSPLPLATGQTANWCSPVSHSYHSSAVVVIRKRNGDANGYVSLRGGGEPDGDDPSHVGVRRRWRGGSANASLAECKCHL